MKAYFRPEKPQPKALSHFFVTNNSIETLTVLMTMILDAMLVDT